MTCSPLAQEDSVSEKAAELFVLGFVGLFFIFRLPQSANCHTPSVPCLQSQSHHRLLALRSPSRLLTAPPPTASPPLSHSSAGTIP